MGYSGTLFSADMKIWIDPNGGHDYDKLQVSCEFRSKISWTCIYPQKYLVSLFYKTIKNIYLDVQSILQVYISQPSIRLTN